jgi:hypothetical protein
MRAGIWKKMVMAYYFGVSNIYNKNTKINNRLLFRQLYDILKYTLCVTFTDVARGTYFKELNVLFRYSPLETE